jgi:D-sedoheptulose 7-phosphate isomerase
MTNSQTDSPEALVRRTLMDHAEVIEALHALVGPITALAERAFRLLSDGGTVFWMGNGGSAADCQHLAAELVGRFQRERPGLASIALTTDSSILTSIGNDYGFDHVFARQVEALCRPGDLLVGLSTSGNSTNVLRAMEVARAIGVERAGLTGGTGGRLCGLVDSCLVVPSGSTARIQEAHVLIGHLLCDLVERRALAAKGRKPTR